MSVPPEDSSTESAPDPVPTPAESPAAVEPVRADAMDEEPTELASVELPEGETPLKRGVSVIADVVKRLPNGPGVYRMIAANGDVLYVGKARSLKKRVTSYTRPTGLSSRIVRMIQATAAMEFVSTRTETEALLLEANLIKRLRPRFNVLLRDDKSFPYILIRRDHPAPPIEKHRGARTKTGDYFGPFASAGAVGRTLNALQKAFLIRSCTDAVYETRTRPCLLHQIKRCAAPCTGEISLEDYGELVREARDFLAGKSGTVKAELARAMEHAAEALDFERAAIYRDRIAALSHVTSHQGINPQSVEEADVFAAYQEGGHTAIQVFFFRTGQNWGNRAYFPKADPSLEAADVLESFLAQFYDDKPVPRLVLLSHALPEQELLQTALSEHAGRKIEVAVPQRGEKRDLVEHALTNAKEALGRRLAETSTQGRLVEGLAAAFGLDRAPRRIEVYDNSHIMGTSPVGAMIVAGPEGFVKKEYRKFNIRSTEITPGDDFGMMREVLSRRFGRLVREAGPRAGGDPTEADDDGGEESAADVSGVGPWPDLVLVDGGAGQLAAARAILDDLGIAPSDLAVVGVAKGVDRDAGRETFYIEGRQPFRLPVRDPVLYFIQRLRDEAHRFAIGSHRARRSREFVANPLDEIAGIGPTRKRALLRHFGTAKAIGRAGVEDLMAVEGISESLARVIFDHFHDGAA